MGDVEAQRRARDLGLAVPAGDQEMDSWSYLAPSRDTWDAVARRCDLADKPWADRLRRTIPQFVAMADLVRPPDTTELTITHTDTLAVAQVLILGD